MEFPTRIVVHSKSDCPYCDQAKAYLTERSVPFTEIKHDDTADRQRMYDQFGLAGKARTVPQIMLTDNGTDYLLSGVKSLQGIESLFRTSAAPMPVAQTAKAEITTGIVVAEEGSSCCE